MRDRHGQVVDAGRRPLAPPACRRSGILCRSTRRFCARPPAVVFGAMQPVALRGWSRGDTGGTPFCARDARTRAARLRQPHVQVPPPAVVRVACDLDPDIRVRDARGRHRVEHRVGVGRERGSAGLKVTPRSTSVGRGAAPGAATRVDSGVNSTRHPFASTGRPGGAGGHWGRAGGGGAAAGVIAATGRAQPNESIGVPGGAGGHLGAARGGGAGAGGTAHRGARSRASPPGSPVAASAAVECARHHPVSRSSWAGAAPLARCRGSIPRVPGGSSMTGHGSSRSIVC